MASGRPPAASDISFWRSCPSCVLAYAVMALVWPWSVVDPLNPFRAAEYFSHFFEKPWQELFGGHPGFRSGYAARLRADAVRAQAADDLVGPGIWRRGRRPACGLRSRVSPSTGARFFS